MDVGRYFGICMLLFIAMDFIAEKVCNLFRWYFLLYGLQHFLTAIFLQSIVMPLWRHGRKKKDNIRRKWTEWAGKRVAVIDAYVALPSENCTE